MKKLLLAGAAALSALSGLAGSAGAADLPVAVVPLPPFGWTSCFLGAHVGGGFAQTNLADPVMLVQDLILGTGATTTASAVGVSPNGLLVGGQMGCDYQFGYSPWVLGAEGAVSGGNLRGNTNIGLPLGAPGDGATVTAKTDFLPSVTARFGYALANWLFYVRAGGAWEGGKYDVTGTMLGTPFGFQGLDNRFGWTAGGGVEWAFGQVWSARVEYDYYGLGQRSALMTDNINAFSGVMNVQQSVQTIKLGVNFHMWAVP